MEPIKQRPQKPLYLCTPELNFKCKKTHCSEHFDGPNGCSRTSHIEFSDEKKVLWPYEGHDDRSITCFTCNLPWDICQAFREKRECEVKKALQAVDKEVSTGDLDNLEPCQCYNTLTDFAAANEEWLTATEDFAARIPK